MELEPRRGWESQGSWRLARPPLPIPRGSLLLLQVASQSAAALLGAMHPYCCWVPGLPRLSCSPRSYEGQRLLSLHLNHLGGRRARKHPADGQKRNTATASKHQTALPHPAPTPAWKPTLVQPPAEAPRSGEQGTAAVCHRPARPASVVLAVRGGGAGRLRVGECGGEL